jgi:hypothetical protein
MKRIMNCLETNNKNTEKKSFEVWRERKEMMFKRRQIKNRK